MARTWGTPRRRPHRSNAVRAAGSEDREEHKDELKKLMKVRGNHIFMYCGICHKSVMELIQMIHAIKDKNVVLYVEESANARIAIQISDAEGDESSDDDEDGDNDDDGEEEEDNDDLDLRKGGGAKALKLDNIQFMAPLLDKGKDGKTYIYLHLCSEGGDFEASIVAHDNIKTIMRTENIEIVTIVEGNASSAATIIAQAGSTRLITPNSAVLIHQLSYGSDEGCHKTYQDIRSNYENTTLCMKIIKGIYAARCKIPKKKFQEMLLRDILIDAKTSLEYGITDAILQ